MNRWMMMFCAVFFTAVAFAQDPVHWDFSVKKISNGKYEVHLRATVTHPWHTYSQSTPDGGPLPTKISFTKNPLLTLNGVVKEVGELKTVHDKTFDVDVKFFPGNVDFVQVVTIRPGLKTNISGTLEYMACNDQQCLPPKTIPFTIPLP